MLKRGKDHKIALRTSLMYALLAGLWIVGSDKALVALVGHTPDLVRYELYKGLGFVIVTAALLYVALRAQLRREETATAARDRAEIELQAQRERVRLAAVAGNIGFWEFEVGTPIAYVSPEWKRYLGYADRDLPDRMDEWQQRIHPDDRARVIADLQAYLARPAGIYRQEYRLQQRDGSYRWILSQGSLQAQGDRRHPRMLGAHVDITASKEAEVALRERAEANARLAHIAAVVPGAIVCYQERSDGCRLFPYASPAVREVYGFSARDIAQDATPVFRRIHPDDANGFRRSLEESARSLSPWRCEFRYDHPAKGEVWLEGFSRPELQPDGNLLWNGFVMDVTARKQTELRMLQLTRVYAVLNDINETIVRVREPQRLFNAVCRIAVEKGGFRMAWIARVSDSPGGMVPVASAGVVDGYLDRLDSSGTGKPDPLEQTRTVLTMGRRYVANDIEHDPLMASNREAALMRGYRAVAILPIRVRKDVIGALHLYAGEPGVFDPPEVQLLDEMALDLSFALEISEGAAPGAGR